MKQMQWKCNVRKRAAKDKTTLDFAKEIERKSKDSSPL